MNPTPTLTPTPQLSSAGHSLRIRKPKQPPLNLNLLPTPPPLTKKQQAKKKAAAAITPLPIYNYSFSSRFHLPPSFTEIIGTDEKILFAGERNCFLGLGHTRKPGTVTYRNYMAPRAREYYSLENEVARGEYARK